MYKKYLDKFLNAPRPAKRAISIAYDVIAISFAYYLSYVLRLNTIYVSFGSPEMFTLGVTVVTSVAFFIRTGLYRAILRYLPPQAILTIIIGILASSIVMIFCAFFTHSFLPRSVPGIYIFVALILIGLPRLLFRNMLHFLAPKGNTPILIYGAGESAHQLVQQLYKSTQFRPIAFIDDNSKLKNNLIMGLKVYPLHQIPSLIKKHNVKIVLLALENSNTKESDAADQYADAPGLP